MYTYTHTHTHVRSLYAYKVRHQVFLFFSLSLFPTNNFFFFHACGTRA